MHHPGVDGIHHPEVEGMYHPRVVVDSTPVGEGAHRKPVGSHLAVVLEGSNSGVVAAVWVHLKLSIYNTAWVMYNTNQGCARFADFCANSWRLDWCSNSITTVVFTPDRYKTAKIHRNEHSPVARPGFPSRGFANPRGGYANPLFDEIFAETVWKWKKNRPIDGLESLAPPARTPSLMSFSFSEHLCGEVHQFLVKCISIYGRMETLTCCSKIKYKNW